MSALGEEFSALDALLDEHAQLETRMSDPDVLSSPNFSSKSLVVTRSFRALKPLRISLSMHRGISRQLGSLLKTIPHSQRKSPHWKKQSEPLTNIFCLSLRREIPMMPVTSSWKSKQVKAVKNPHSLPQISPGCICAMRIRRGGRLRSCPPLTPS